MAVIWNASYKNVSFELETSDNPWWVDIQLNINNYMKHASKAFIESSVLKIEATR